MSANQEYITRLCTLGLTKNDLVLSAVEGKEVFTFRTDFMSKTHQGGVGGSCFESAGCIQDNV